MQKHAKKRNSKKIILPVAGLLTVALVATTVYQTSEQASAKASLPGIETITNNNNLSAPFKVLEIVPDYKEARMGYLVAGEEPAYYDTTKGVMALADMASDAERTARYPANEAAFSSAPHDFSVFSILKDKAYTWTDSFDDNKAATDADVVTYSVMGDFAASDSGSQDYINNNDSSTAYLKVGGSGNIDTLAHAHDATYNGGTAETTTTGNIYMDEAVFTLYAAPDGSSDRYDLTFKKFTDADPKMPFKVYTDAASINYYNREYYGLETQITPVYTETATGIANSDPYYKIESGISDGTVLYVVSIDGSTAQYYGYVTTDSGELKFVQTDGSKIAINGDTQTDSLAGIIYALKESGREIYTIGQTTASNENKFYISNVTLNNTSGVVSMDLNLKVLRVPAGESTDLYGISIDDDLSYHDFFYMPSNQDAFTYAGYNTANANAKYNFVHDYSKSTVETFYYTGGFTNNEWFKQYVLDREASECAATIVDVDTKLASEVTTSDLENYSLIYIQGGSYTTDISDTVAKALVNSIVSNYKAVIIEGASLYNGTASSPNLHKLSILLTQPNLSLDQLKNAAEDTYWADADNSRFSSLENLSTAKVANKLDANGNEVTLDAKDNMYTTLSVFVNNYTAGSTVDGDFITTISDTSGYSYKVGDSTYTVGYSEVQSDIDNEKFYLSVANSSAAFNDQISKATCIRHILNYGERRTTTKAELRVLDLEPYYSEVFENNTSLFSRIYYKVGWEWKTTTNAVYDASSRDIFSKDWFITTQITQISADEKDSKIDVTGMGTREFIGNIDDLNANYDLIYIGLDTQYMNTSVTTSGSSVIKSTDTIYNMESLNGKVYTHIGDSMTAQQEYGNLGDTMVTSDKTVRTSGNDITYEKLRDLKSYVQAGYAVLLSDEFYTYSNDGKVVGVNTDKIDINSYMYDFADWIINEKNADGTQKYFGKNVTVKHNLYSDANTKKVYPYTTLGAVADGVDAYLENRETFSKYLNISKLEISTVNEDGYTYTVPTPYFDESDSSTGEYQYLTMNSDGIYTLDFEVKLTNDSAVDTGNTSYNCKLYIDHDADGRYEAVEALSGLSITKKNGDSWDAVGTDNDGVYHLTTGNVYRISRRVPEGYVGFLSWKLVFYDNTRAMAVDDESDEQNLVRTAIQGYSAVPDYSERPDINILQIVCDHGKWGAASCTLDLTSSDMKALYNEVKDFNINVTKIGDTDLIKNVIKDKTPDEVLDYFMQYDMLVMGFADGYDTGYGVIGNSSQDELAQLKLVYAIREYILSGKSMLFTHDLNSKYYETYNDSLRRFGYYANEYLRDLQGMDRYGTVQSEGKLDTLASKLGVTLTEYKSKYDNDSKSRDTSNNLIDRYGWGTSMLLRYHFYSDNTTYATGYGETSYLTTNGFQRFDSGDTKDRYVSNTITQVNRGQITEYPFHIEEQIEVAQTHPQYFQLNLDTDSQDDNYDDDIVVWYTISNQNTSTSDINFYTADYNDVRNNYYIYNKGNVTYTGSGHRAVTSDQERKLFVNTLVAAYNAGDHAPYVKYKQSAWEMAADITSMYEPYDADLNEVGGFIEDEISVNFKTINNNLQSNTYTDDDGVVRYKSINAQYYVEASAGEAGAIQIGGLWYRVITPTSMTYEQVSADGLTTTTTAWSNPYVLDNYTIYTAKFKVSDITSTVSEDGKQILSTHNKKIYVRLSMDTSSSAMTVGTGTTTYPATDSITPLQINFTELYELR